MEAHVCRATIPWDGFNIEVEDLTDADPSFATWAGAEDHVVRFFHFKFGHIPDIETQIRVARSIAERPEELYEALRAAFEKTACRGLQKVCDRHHADLWDRVSSNLQSDVDIIEELARREREGSGSEQTTCTVCAQALVTGTSPRGENSLLDFRMAISIHSCKP